MTGVEKLIIMYNSTEPCSMSKNILGNMLQNLNHIEHMNIYDLADACFVSPASISRMIKKLGYKNYSYFQKDIADCAHKYEYHNRIVVMDKIVEEEDIHDVFFNTLDKLFVSMRQTLDKGKLKKLAETIHESRKTSLYAFEASFAESFLQYDIFMSGKVCEVYKYIPEMKENAKSLSEQDLVIMVAPKQIEGTAVDDVMTEVKRTGAKTCVVTDSKHFAVLKKQIISLHLKEICRQLMCLFYKVFYACSLWSIDNSIMMLFDKMVRTGRGYGYAE